MTMCSFPKNSKKNLPLLLAMICGLCCLAQEKIPFVDYGSVYEKVDEAAQKGAYEEALGHLDKISKNDSIYCDVLISKSYYLMTLKRFDDAIAVIDEGLQNSCYDLHSSFYINKQVAFLRQEHYQKAIAMTEEGFERFPQNKTLWFNKGVALEALGKIEEAVAAYQKTIYLDPYYKSAYLQLGNLCYQQERISQALMCYNMYLLLEPDATDAFDTLKSINDLVKSKNEHSRNPDIKISEDDDSFEEIDLIINNRVALNTKYETGNEIDIALTKQNHALLQSLKNFSGNGGFWDTKLVPFYQWVIKQDFFDAFTYTISYSIENEAYKKIVDKKIDEIQNLFDLSKTKWAELVKNTTVTEKGATKVVRHYFDDGYTKGIGRVENEVIVGPWQLFNSTGRLTAKGVFNAKGKREGMWEFYNEQGNLSETAEYLNGEVSGKNIVYFDNGRKKIVTTYKNDELDGEYLLYNRNGALKQKKYFKEGKLEGVYETFHDVGAELLESKALYENGNIKERYIEYYANGAVDSEVNFKNGEAHGREIEYHPNGTPSTDLISKNGYANGYYKTFHANGSPKWVGQTTEGSYSGDWQTFYHNGTLQSEYRYDDKGKLDGDYNYYDTDGKLHYTFEYRRGEILAYKYYDKAGDLIEENRKKGGEFYYRGYSPYGKVITEGLYDIKGGKKGVWKYYTTHGVLTDEGNYEDDKAVGAYKTYHSNGKIASVSQYQKDTLSGYYLAYHANGQIKTQGWHKDDELHGEWRRYTPDGILKEINFYHKGTLHGEQLLFSPRGVKTQRVVYEYDTEVTDTYFDPEGNESFTIAYENDDQTGERIYWHYNKKPSYKFTMVNGVKHGPYTGFDFYGNKTVAGQYLNGKAHGEWTWYHDNGAVETTINYLNGEWHGEYVSYFEDGTMDGKYNYSLGKLEGNVVYHYENGAINTKSYYENDELQGRRETYGPDGALQLVRFYEHGRLMGYSHLDKNGIEIAMVPIENESGKITTYYDNGNVSREMEYRNGYLINDYREYYYSGQQYEKAFYVDGGFDGKRTEYFPNGGVKLEEMYQLGKLSGSTKTYFENGKLKKEETYKNNIKDGIAKKYTEDGTLLVEEVYFNGDIVSSTSK